MPPDPPSGSRLRRSRAPPPPHLYYPCYGTAETVFQYRRLRQDVRRERRAKSARVLKDLCRTIFAM